jgi:hypothetical protein
MTHFISFAVSFAIVADEARLLQVRNTRRERSTDRHNGDGDADADADADADGDGDADGLPSVHADFKTSDRLII